MKMLDYPESYVKKAAIIALGKIGTQEAVSGIVKGFRDPDKLIRKESVKALMRIGSPEAVSGLTATFTCPDSPP